MLTGKIFKKLIKIAIYTLAGVLLLFSMVWGAIQIPATQKYLIDQVTTYLHNKLKTKVEIKRVNIEFFRTVVLEDIFIADQQADTLLYARKFRVKLNNFSLLHKQVYTRDIELENASVHLHRPADSLHFNYNFLLEAFASNDTTTTVKDSSASGWQVDLHQIRLKNVKMHWLDNRDKLFLQTQMKGFEVNFETLGLDNQHPVINRLAFDQLKLNFHHAPHQQNNPNEQEAQADAVKAKNVTNDIAKTNLAPHNEKTVLNPSGYKITLKSLVFKNCNLRYDNDSRIPQPQNIDYHHTSVTNFSTEIKNIEIGENKFGFDIKSLAFAEKSGFRLQQLALNVNINYPQVFINMGRLQTSRSVFHRGFKFNIPSVEAVEPSLKSVFFNAHFENDSLSLRDVAIFTGGISPVLQQQTIKANGNIDVRKHRLHLDHLALSLNNKNKIKTSLVVKDFTDYARAHYNFELQTLEAKPAFVQKLIPQPLPSQLMLMPYISTRLNLSGFLKGLKGEWQLDTGLGELVTEFKAQTNGKFDNNALQATIKAQAVQVGTLAGVADAGALSFNAYVNATNTPEKTQVDTLNMMVSAFEYKKYVYQGLKVVSRFVDNIAQSDVYYQDEKADFKLHNVVDLTQITPRVFLQGNINKLELQGLNLFDQKLTVKTRLIGELKGFDVDSLTGYLGIGKAKVDYLDKKLTLDSLRLTIDKKDSIRDIVLKSDIMDAHITGQFYFKELPEAMDKFVKSYYSGYLTDSVKLKHTEHITINAQIHKNPKLLYAFVPGLYLPFNMDIGVTFDAQTNLLMAQVRAPLLGYAGEEASNFYINLRTRRNKLKLFWTCSNIETKEKIDIQSPSFRSTFQKDKASFSLNIRSDSLKSGITLHGDVKARTDTFALTFTNSHIEIEKQKWKFRENCKITFNPYNHYLFIDSVALSQGSQKLLFRSRQTHKSKIIQKFDIVKFNIASIPQILGLSPYKLGGIIDGGVGITNVFDIEKIKAKVKIKKLKALDIPLGDLTLGVSEQGLKGLVRIQMLIKGKNNRIRANGSYDIYKDSLYMFAGISHIKLDQFKPLVADYMKQLHGRVNARLRLTGSISQPTIKGDIKFKGKSTLQVKMLGEPHFINNQSIYFEGDWIRFKNFTITDQNGQTNTINGKIHNLGYSAFYTNLQIKGDNFQLMKSTAYDFKTLHGTVFSDYDIKVNGLLDDLKIDADVALKPGSNVYTSIDDDEATHIQHSNFIELTSTEKDSTKLKDSTRFKANTNLTGFTVNSVIKVTPETKLHIIIDESTNDRLECSGTTELSVSMDNTGELEISGDYIIETGKYTMNLFEVVHKEIEVQKGSSVHFFGDPTQGVMNITTIYETKTSTYSLLLNRISAEQATEIEQAKRIIPVQVLIHLRGEFLNPQISFDIVIPKDRVRNPSTILTSKLNEIRNNQNELYKQVFGLIVLGHFITTEEAQGGNGVDVTYQLGSGLSGFLTDQLNKLSDNYLGGVQINLDLNNKNDFSKDRELAVHLSKQFFNDRLRVSVGSFVSLDNHDNNEQNTHQNLIGDVTVEYRLNKTGNLNLKFFRKTNTNNSTTSTLTQQTNQTNGFSVSYHKNFSRLGDLFRRKKVKKPQPPKKKDKKKKENKDKKKEDDKEKKGGNNTTVKPDSQKEKN